MATHVKGNELCSFDVPEFERSSNGNANYKIVLQITPRELTENTYQLVYWKRYTDIRKLYDTLHRYHQAVYRPDKFPDIPEKPRFLERFDATVAEERRVATKIFLNYALQQLYLRTHDAYVEFFQKGEKVPLPDVHTVPLQPEVLSSHLDAAPATPPEVLSLASIDAANNDGALLTTEEQEKIERVAHNCAQMVADLNDQQAEQREEIKRENEEFNLIKQEVDEAADLLSLPLATTTDSNSSF